MQPHYEMANIFYHEPMVDDCCSSTLQISGPLRPNQNNGHHLHQHYNLQYQRHPQHKQRQKELCHEYEQVHLLHKNHQLFQHPHQFQASQEEQQSGDLQGGNERCTCESLPHYLGIPNCRQPQEESTARLSFWKAFNTVLSDAKGKHQQVNENERCLVSENNYGELEAVYILAQNNKEANQTCSASALAGKNSNVDDSVCLPLSDCQQPNASARATTGVDRVSQAFVGEEASMKRARKRMRKTEMEEEVGLMSAFFQNFVKRVINHQEFLQNKFVELIERMDKERAEREEAWKRQETEIYDREAIARAHERDLASVRESSIVSYIERITGQSFNNLASRTNDQESTIDEH